MYFAGHQLADQRLVDRRLSREVERLEGFEHRKLRGLDPPLGRASFSIDQLAFAQSQQVGRVIGPLFGANPSQGFVFTQYRWQLELLEVMLEQDGGGLGAHGDSAVSSSDR